MFRPRIAHIPVTSSITSFVFRNHGVHGGLYPAADAVAPGAGFTPSLDSSPLSSASFSAMRDWHRFPLNVFAAITRAADIVVAAIGRPHFLGSDHIREGAVVIDVGINRIDDPSNSKGYRLVGDVDYDAVADRCAAITPVPGGVGPMTIAMLMSNCVTAAERLTA